MIQHRVATVTVGSTPLCANPTKVYCKHEWGNYWTSWDLTGSRSIPADEIAAPPAPEAPSFVAFGCRRARLNGSTIRKSVGVFHGTTLLKRICLDQGSRLQAFGIVYKECAPTKRDMWVASDDIYVLTHHPKDPTLVGTLVNVKAASASGLTIALTGQSRLFCKIQKTIKADMAVLDELVFCDRRTGDPLPGALAFYHQHHQN